ncbi:collagen alpha-6(VI) chain-like [Liolophura sinensis]|uniref:collagen alpha-6(VI) chain-like n=1 Tax=Liolophura sinensis TaxID=3198878 RepID=UPI0031593BDD
MFGVLCFAVISALAILGQGGAVKFSTRIVPKAHTDHDGTLCPYKADIVILMDASSSIGHDNYQVMKNFLRGVVQHFDVGQDNVRVGLITFNFGALVEFNLNQFSTKEEVLQAFDHVQDIHQGTATHRALKYAREISFTAENGDRPDIPNVAILLTDGQSTHPDKTATEQALLKAAGVRVFAIGIGWVDEAELRLIASDPVDKYFHYVKDFSGLDEILAEFQQTSCAEITRPLPTTPVPTTTLAPTTTTKKPCPYTADVMILMDASSSIGPENFEQMRQFLLGVIGHFEIGEDRVRVGLITFNFGARQVFYLNTYHTKEEVIRAFAPLRGTEVGTATHAALRIARETGFTSEHGDRPGIPNIAILITDGRSTHPDRTATEQALLKAAGVRVFAIGIGWTDENELRLIASDPDEQYFHYVKNFDGLENIMGEFQDTSCNDITRPLTYVETPKPTPPPAKLKPGRSDLCLSKGDVVFVLDTSSSVGPAGLQREKEFIIDILYEFDIGLDSVRVAVITFDLFSRIEFNLDTYTTRDELISAIMSITTIQVGTNTHKALDQVRTGVLGTSSDRPDVKDIVVVVTDGRSRQPDLTRDAAIALKAQGPTVFAVGVGNVDTTEIDTISSEPNSQHSFFVDDFDALSAIKDSVVDKTCDYCHVADMIIIMDASSSIGEEDYTTMKNFVKDFLQFFVIGQERVRVGLLTYNVNPHIEFQLNSFYTHAPMFAAIDNLNPTAVGTWTDKALKTAREVMLTEVNGARVGSPKLVITLTDGQSRDPNATIAQANLMKATGAQMFSIGIGKWISQAELKVLASRDDYVFEVANFDGLATIEAQLQRKTCNATATPWPVGCNAVGDIIFVFDSSSHMSIYDFELAKNFSAELVKDLRIANNKARVGAVKFHDDAVLEFPLNFSYDKSTIIKSLLHIQKSGSASRVDKAFNELHTVAFKDCLGDRDYVPNVAVFLTNGNFQNPMKAAEYTIAAANAGVRVFSVGIGNKVNSVGVDMLAPRNTGAQSFLINGRTDVGRIRSELLSHICHDYSPCL